MSTDYSEDTLVEQPTIELFSELEYETANCFYEKVGTSDSTLGRETTAEVILIPKLRQALEKLNPELPSDAINLAIEALARDRSAMSLVQANREVYKLLKDGVKVSFQNDDGEETDETVRVIDWRNPGNNDLFLASQFWVSTPLSSNAAAQRISTAWKRISSAPTSRGRSRSKRATTAYCITTKSAACSAFGRPPATAARGSFRRCGLASFRIKSK